MKALILSAGKGKRLQPITNEIPKPMVPINNLPLLEYNILLCKKYGIREIAINTSHLPEKIRNYFKNGKKWGINIKYSYEPKLLGTSGSLNNFRDFLKETFVIIYGDNLTDIDLTRMLEYHKRKNSIITLALRKKPKEYKTQSLLFANDELKITKFLEKPSDEEVKSLSVKFKLINSGIYICEPEILDHIPQNQFSDFAKNIFPQLINQNKDIFGFMMDQYYFREVGKIEKYELAKNEIESGKIVLNFLK
jgi:mannose-1-phosphate guanylyltransferase / phosphomannomutase